MIKREAYLKRIRPFIGNDLIKVMTGMRRTGKSVMLELIKKELQENKVESGNIISINFEDMRNSHLLNAEALHSEMLRRSQSADGKLYLFFDEIQEVDSWEKCINSLRVVLDCDIYITGSNARLLSGELSTYLGGRYVEFIIYPFSFSEFTELKRQAGEVFTLEEAFKTYLLLGGMPYLGNLGYEENASKLYLRDLFNSVQLKDIIQRNQIRDVDLLERIILYVAANVGEPFSATSIVKYFKNEQRRISVDTVLNYIKYCCDSYLFYKVSRLDIQGKQLLSSKEKYYMADHGIREAVYGRNIRDINLILENIVYMEALRRGYKVTVGKNGEKEVDFVCENGDERIYIQVAYLLADETTIKREFGVYSSIKDNFAKYVITLDEFDMSSDGIRHKNIRDFLIEDNWN